MTREERAWVMLAQVLPGYGFSESDKRAIALAMAAFADAEAGAMRERAAGVCDGLALSAAAVQAAFELARSEAPTKAIQRECAAALATAIRALSTMEAGDVNAARKAYADTLNALCDVRGERDAAALEAAAVAREAGLFRAVLNRIARMGDMHIRVRGRTFAMILSATGFDTDTLDQSEYREVEAAALEALIRKASG